MRFLKIIKDATLLVTLLNGKVVKIEEFKNGNYKITVEGIDIREIDFLKFKKLWECFDGLVKTDAGSKPDPELISYMGKGYTPFELRNGNKSEIIVLTNKEYKELCKYLEKIRS